MGVPGRVGWQMVAPRGMVLIRGGVCMIGSVDEDIAGKVTPNRQVSISSFYMDETEITNNQYRQFIEAMLAKASSANNEGIEEAFVMEKLHPDTTVWMKDFAHHMGDPMMQHYYKHPAFDHYPVVGVTWEAAKYFAKWRTEYLNDYRAQKKLYPMPDFMLPTAVQYEFAARGGKTFEKYPWGGPYVRDEKGNLYANFKSSRGNYIESGSGYTSNVRHFPPNDYGLYDMAGNVSEWCLDAYNPRAIYLTCDLNPVYLDENQPLKIIKGGSWKDIARYLQTGISDYEHKDSARSYIGFRCVMAHIGDE